MALLLVTGCGGATSGTSDDAPAGETRTVATAMGDVEVPADPQRVVVSTAVSWTSP